MKRIKLFALLAAAVIAFASCGKPAVKEDLIARECLKIHKGDVNLNCVADGETDYTISGSFTVEVFKQVNAEKIAWSHENVWVSLQMLDKNGDYLCSMTLDPFAVEELVRKGSGKAKITGEAYFENEEDAKEVMKKTASFKVDNASVAPFREESISNW